VLAFLFERLALHRPADFSTFLNGSQLPEAEERSYKPTTYEHNFAFLVSFLTKRDESLLLTQLENPLKKQSDTKCFDQAARLGLTRVAANKIEC